MGACAFGKGDSQRQEQQQRPQGPSLRTRIRARKPLSGAVEWTQSLRITLSLWSMRFQRSERQRSNPC